MEKLQIYLEDILKSKSLTMDAKNYYWIENNQFNKIVKPNKLESKFYKVFLKLIEEAYNEVGTIKLNGINYPNQLFYLGDCYLGTSSLYLDGYKDIDSVIYDLSYSEKIDILKKYSLVLKSLHNNGFAHNDLKSGNNVMVKNGDVQVIDFEFIRKITGCSSFENRTLKIINTSFGDYIDLMTYITNIITVKNENGTVHVPCGLPKEIIKEYKAFIEAYTHWHDYRIIKKIPTSYPDEWLDELKCYSYVDKRFQK
ncbi:MAG: hypothetical protein RSA10_02135 [Bacilli bacterium]